jgi:ABC-2 type transport system permease protein
MNMQSSAIESMQATVPIAVTIPVSRRFYWSVRREFWEYRSIYVAPLAIAALFLVAFLVGLIHLPTHMRGALAIDPVHHQDLLEQPYTFVAYVFMAITFIVAIFYCLDTLYGERRDRSILFWKSLPVSDLIAVLAKATIPIFALPLITFVLTIVTQWIMLLLSSVVFLARGQSVAVLWDHVPLFQMSLMLFFHLIAIHGLQFAPVYGWMLLVSAWAPRAPLLWAVLPPLGIGIAEKIAFNTRHFADLMGYLIGGGPDAIPFSQGRMEMVPLTAADVAKFLTNPGLWVGLAVTALFLVAAVRVRRSREPI